MANKPARVIPKESPIDATPMENSLFGSGIYRKERRRSVETQYIILSLSRIYFDGYLVERIDISSATD
jgi:hypothetical protein